MDQYLNKNRKLVKSVFDKVYDNYDLMNDLMSFGAHRIWKKRLISLMNPSVNQSLVDVGCGTGDIGKYYSDVTNKNSNVLSVDPNQKMINKGKERLKQYKNIKWQVNSGEFLNVKDETYDFYTISFGIRNTTDIEKTISEAFRVLKKGGRFLCLEFSKIENKNLNFLYKQYSKFIPNIGKFVVGDENPYKYLTSSIDKFLNQEELLRIIEKNNFVNCKYYNLSGGIVAIHSAWKI